MGDGKRALKPIREILDNSDIPMNVFHPTHCNRNPRLLEEAIEFLKVGGSVDLTCGLPGHDTPTDVILRTRSENISQEKITISSDGNGSWSRYDDDGNLIKIGVASTSSLLNEFKELIKANLNISDALIYTTENVAKILKLDKTKGSIDIGKDGDLLIFDKDFNLNTVIAMGEVLLKDGQVLKEKVIEFD
ncbi:MAG: amidohydrolase family protein [Tissierellia bacterium]|nr:amidohydrolase family protein [Tissierellia bacterium]